MINPAMVEPAVPRQAKWKLFGLRISIDPRIIVVVLLLCAIAIYYFNSVGERRQAPAAGAAPAFVSRTATVPPLRPAAVRRSSDSRSNAHTKLRLVPIDGSRGDVDPMLRLRSLDGVRSVVPSAPLRNLFEAEKPAVASPPPMPKGPLLLPKPKPNVSVVVKTPPPMPAFGIPLKYYGFAPSGPSLNRNCGFFMDGDNILLLGAEGDLLERRYLITALTPNSARVKDTKMKQEEDVPMRRAAQ